MKTQILLVPTFAVSLLAGCGGAMTRTEAQWTEDTYKLLETQNEAIKKCYNDELKKNPRLEGSVVVDFHVDNKTGRFKKVRIDKKKTTAGDPVRKCVTQVVQDLKLTPGDS
ncbi:MAG: AgmX/PglI C-terminal domain-containing protein, partial [Myxococcales bacterium]|nr:AgmX/PglI C-terminal domain-containing protein [Myxococcales bacterium]